MHLAMEEFDWPFFALKNDIPRQLRQWRGRLDRFALATLVARTGSAPQPVGCQMLIGEDGLLAGYVSGGCVESNLAVMAQEVIETGKGRFVSFGDGSPFLDVRLPCGTRIDLAIEAFRRTDPAITALIEHGEKRRPALFVSDLAGGDHLCIPLDSETEDIPLVQMILAEKPMDRLPVAGRVGETYWTSYRPTPRLVINGGDPVALALALMAQVCGFEVIVNRRDGPAQGIDHPEILYHRKDAKALFEALPPDSWTAVVTTTHDLEIDHDILVHALPSPAFYVGVLGSRSHLPDRRKMLEAAGVDEAAIARMAAPVGLAIGAVSPNEIAAAIIADVIRAWRKR